MGFRGGRGSGGRWLCCRRGVSGFGWCCFLVCMGVYEFLLSCESLLGVGAFFHICSGV